MEQHEDRDDIAEDAADATEEPRAAGSVAGEAGDARPEDRAPTALRAHAGRRIEDEPESGLIAGEPPDDEVDPRL